MSMQYKKLVEQSEFYELTKNYKMALLKISQALEASVRQSGPVTKKSLRIREQEMKDKLSL